MQKQAIQTAQSKKLNAIYNSLSNTQKEQINKEAQERFPDIIKPNLLKNSPVAMKMLESEKREVLKEWIKTNKIKQK